MRQAMPDLPFFTKLRDDIKSLNMQCIWVAGDWNVSYSTLPPGNNPDIENHQGFNNSSSIHINSM